MQVCGRRRHLHCRLSAIVGGTIRNFLDRLQAVLQAGKGAGTLLPPVALRSPSLRRTAAG